MGNSDWPFAAFLIVLVLCITSCTIHRDRLESGAAQPSNTREG